MTATAIRPAGSQSDGALSHRQILTILSGLVLGMFLAALDQTIVSTAIKTIGNDLHDLQAQAWVTTAFLITSTIAAPLFGKLSDIYGRKRLFMTAIVIFVAGSALCGLATSMYELAGFRAFQGIGAGGIMPLALAVIGDIIPPRERARYQGYMMAVFASASVLGPVLGGLLAGTNDFLGVAGWRYIFYINVPIAAVALFVIARVLKLDTVRRQRRIDWWGALALVVGLVPLLVVAEEGQQWGWASAASFTAYLLSAVGLAVFVWIQHRMGDDALLPLRMFRSRTFSVASGQVTIIGMAMFGGLSVIPLYLQIVKGASPTKSGLLLLPLVAGMMLVLARLRAADRPHRPLQGLPRRRLGADGHRHGPVRHPAGRHRAVEHRPLHGDLRRRARHEHAEPGAGHAERGARARTWASPRPPRRSSARSAERSAPRSSCPCCSPRRAPRSRTQYAGAARDPAYIAAAKANPGQVASLQQHLSGGLSDTSFLSGLARPLVHPFFVGFSSAADVVFAITAVLLVGAIVLSSCLKEVPLRLMSGNQARAQASESEGAAAPVESIA